MISLYPTLFVDNTTTAASFEIDNHNHNTDAVVVGSKSPCGLKHSTQRSVMDNSNITIEHKSVDIVFTARFNSNISPAKFQLGFVE